MRHALDTDLGGAFDSDMSEAEPTRAQSLIARAPDQFLQAVGAYALSHDGHVGPVELDGLHMAEGLAWCASADVAASEFQSASRRLRRASLQRRGELAEGALAALAALEALARMPGKRHLAQDAADLRALTNMTKPRPKKRKGKSKEPVSPAPVGPGGGVKG